MSISSANLQTLYHCVCCIPRLLSSLSVQLRTGVLLRVLTCSDSVEEQTTEEEGGCNTCRTAVAQCIFLHAFLHMPVSRRIWNILDCISNSLIREDPLTLTILHVILPNTVAAKERIVVWKMCCFCHRHGNELACRCAISTSSALRHAVTHKTKESAVAFY